MFSDRPEITFLIGLLLLVFFKLYLLPSLKKTYQLYKIGKQYVLITEIDKRIKGLDQQILVSDDLLPQVKTRIEEMVSIQEKISNDKTLTIQEILDLNIHASVIEAEAFSMLAQIENN
jgi:hypothetical protein